MSQEAAARAFFAAPNFAVVGASTDPAKFGHKSAYSPSRLSESNLFLSCETLFGPTRH
jgi:hypothetical protein